MRFRSLRACFTILAVCVAAGCATQKPVDDAQKPEEEKLTAGLYLSRGMELLAAPGEYGFLAWINTNQPSFPGETATLLSEYSARERKILDLYRAKKDWAMVRHHFNNLLAASTTTDTEADKFNRSLIQRYVEAGDMAAAKALMHERGMDTSSETKVPFATVQEYTSVLAEVHVELLLKRDNGRARKLHFFGSGFLAAPRLVLTNFHVVEDTFHRTVESAEITVKFGDTYMSKCKVLAWDTLMDIAVIELPEEMKVPYSIHQVLGDSSKLKPGFEVYCLGNPLGLSATLTKGIVSALDRTAFEAGRYLQIDAAASFGSSGGLVIGQDRRIYGMIVGGMDSNFGIAIPSNMILSVVDRLMKGNSIRRPWLGIKLSETWKKNGDVVIQDVFPNSPLIAFQPPLDAVLLELNHKPVTSIRQAQTMLLALEAGNIVHMAIKSEAGGRRDLYLPLGLRPEHPIFSALPDLRKFSNTYLHFGFTVSDAPLGLFTVSTNAKTGEKVELPVYLVRRVLKDSTLDRLGVEVGDSVGFVEDEIGDDSRRMVIIHVPKARERSTFYIYTLKQGNYDANIL